MLRVFDDKGQSSAVFHRNIGCIHSLESPRPPLGGIQKIIPYYHHQKLILFVCLLLKLYLALIILIQPKKSALITN